MARYRASDIVVLTRKECVDHFAVAGMTITGYIEEIRPGRKQGPHTREYLIRFEDGRSGWYDKREFRRVHNTRISRGA